MILLNFFPEILMAINLLFSLLLLNFGAHSRGLLPLWVAGSSLCGMIYFLFRPDLSLFDGNQAMLHADSFTHFVRMFSMLILSGFSMSWALHRRLSLKDKQRAVLFLQFFSLFVCGLAFARNLPMFLVSFVGVYFCSINLVLVESGSDSIWVRAFRNRSPWFASWGILVVVLFGLSSHLLGVLDLAEWGASITQNSGNSVGMGVLVILVIVVGVLPLISAQMVGNAPIGLAVFALGNLLALQSFWFRAGVPVLTAYPGVAADISRLFIGLVIGIIILKGVFHSVRTRDDHTWLSAIYPVLIGMAFFSILLPTQQALSTFYILALGLFFTFLMVSFAFSDSGRDNKALILLSLIALTGAPPLVLGDRYFQLIKDLLQASNPIAAVAVAGVWFGLLIASIQIIGKILLLRSSKENQRSFTGSEAFFMGIYLIGVVALSALRPVILSVLNHRPPSNLW